MSNIFDHLNGGVGDIVRQELILRWRGRAIVFARDDHRWLADVFETIGDVPVKNAFRVGSAGPEYAFGKIRLGSKTALHEGLNFRFVLLGFR